MWFRNNNNYYYYFNNNNNTNNNNNNNDKFSAKDHWKNHNFTLFIFLSKREAS